MVSLGGCTATLGPNPAGTPLPVANCVTKPAVTARSWVSADRQIVGSLNGGAVGQISHFVYPLGLPHEDEFAPTRPTFTTWAPDGKHLATFMQVITPVNQVTLYPFVVDTLTHSVTQVPLPTGLSLSSPTFMEWARERGLAWADNHTLLILAPSDVGLGGFLPFHSTPLRYDLTTQTVTPLPGVHDSIQGVVRCGTLFYLAMTEMTEFLACVQNPPSPAFYWNRGAAFLHRYNLATHTEIGYPYTLGQTSSCPFLNDGKADAMGWDVSADGSLLVYQQTSVTQLSPFSIQTTSQFMALQFNTTPPTPILIGAQSSEDAYVAIAPDQKDVVVAATMPFGQPLTAPVYWGTVAGGAASSLSPSAGGLPAWYADSTGFAASQAGGEIPDGGLDIEQYQLGVPNAVGQIATADHPTSLP